MVFYLPPKRLRGKGKDKGKAPAAATTLSHLPDELLLRILEHSNTSDILKVRLVCSDVVPACNTALQKRLTTLYIHPSKPALHRVIEICAHPVFCQEIEEVVLLGKVQWKEIETEWPSVRGFGPGPGNAYPTPDPIAESSSSALSKGSNKFRAWPYSFPSPETVARSIDEEEERATENALFASAESSPPEDDVLSRFRSAYVPFTHALSRLPKLKKLAFAEAVKAEGFNQIAERTMDAHAYKCRSENVTNTCFGTEADPKLMKSTRTRRFADVEVLFGLVFDPQLHFSSLRQEAELPFVEDFFDELGGWRVDASLPHLLPLSTFTNLEFYIDCGWPIHMRKLWNRVILRASRAVLQRLRIVFTPNATVNNARLEETLHSLFRLGITLPKLKFLELELDGSSATHAQGSTRRTRNPRPSCQVLDLTSFLSNHRRTLTDIRFKNIIFTDPDYDVISYPKDALEIVRDSLEVLKKSKTLQKIEWVVNRFEHDSRCRRLDGDPMTECSKFDCGIYHSTVPGMLQALALDDFEGLCAEMGLELEEERRVWDFGECIMREFASKAKEASEGPK